MTAARILVVDGNVAQVRARQAAALGYDSGVGYSRVLHRIEASLQIDIVLAADGAVEFPTGVGLDDYDGVTMTGSALNIYNGGPPVMHQIDPREGSVCRRDTVLWKLLGAAGCGYCRRRGSACQSAGP